MAPGVVAHGVSIFLFLFPLRVSPPERRCRYSFSVVFLALLARLSRRPLFDIRRGEATRFRRARVRRQSRGTKRRPSRLPLARNRPDLKIKREQLNQERRRAIVEPNVAVFTGRAPRARSVYFPREVTLG